MKNWFGNNRLLGATVYFGLFVSLGLSRGVHAGTQQEAQACLDRGDTPCVAQKIQKLLAEGAQGIEVEVIQAYFHFYEGRMTLAVNHMQAAKAAEPGAFEGEGFLAGQLALMERTQVVHDRLVETSVGDITIVHHPGMDRILIEDTVRVLTAARKRIAPLLGGDPPLPLRVEIYPTGADLTACTGLPLDAVQTTGVVAISKWNRLLITSPRAMGGGYGWQDTLVHEWIHLVASWHSAEGAPIWLQEGIAKGLDMLWRREDFELPVHMQSFLATALREDDFVGFEEMHPSFALLDSAERAGLAYAQVATMMAFLREKAGSAAIAKVLARIEAGAESESAVAAVFGTSFAQFQRDWKVWVSQLDLVQQRLSAMPTILDGQGGDFAGDPVLAARKDLQDKARLGDLMAQRKHYDAAVIYYEQAIPEDAPAGPELVERLALSLIKMGDEVRAVRWLEAVIKNYPEHAGTRKLLAERYLIAGKQEAALAQFKASADIYPYSPALQSALIALYKALGESGLAEKHQRYLDILNYRDSG
jgi:tetratricopeptide (TPR) repeat protein